MTFNSLQFVAFFVVVLAIYHRLDRRGQNWTIVVAASIFYATFDWRFLGLLYLTIGVNYLVGRGLGTSEDPGRRKALVGVSLAVQLGILGFFKYFDFFSESVSEALSWIGLDTDPVLLDVLLPIGISFYTFQALAYVFSVYRGELEAERDLVTFAAFIAWFPQMLAGPIERATTLLPQIRRQRERPTAALVESALVLIVRGLFKKVVIADGVAVYVNAIYGNPGNANWAALVLASVGFAVQVYGDFAGYSDMARGVSRLLGVELRWNFEQPFLSRDMREFWQRWHTSLGWWFTEFVGRPLGGASGGQLRAGINVLIIFTLIGLWHGAAWTFVFWGFFNGVLVAYHRFRPAPRNRHPMRLAPRDIFPIVVTFGLFCVGAVFFRAASMGQALDVLTNIATLSGGRTGPSDGLLIPLALAAVLVLDLLERDARIRGIEETRTPARLGGVANLGQASREVAGLPTGTIAGGLALGVLAVGILVFSGGTNVPFIYFQF